MPTSDPSPIIPPAPTGAAGAPLGRSAEIVPTERPLAARQGAISRRYALQRIAQRCLPEHRVATCMRQVQGGVVEVLHHPEHGTASYGGLTTCGNAWVCSVCSSKVLTRKGEELDEGAKNWTAQGGHLMMLTLTLRHERGVSLKEYLKALRTAYRLLRKGNMWDLFAERNGYQGAVTRLEITHGASGWHPHFHALWFLKENTARDDIERMSAWIKKRWVAILARLGYFATEEHGADLRRADTEVIDYIAKLKSQWSVKGELTDAGEKTALRGNETFAQLLLRADTGDAEAVYLVREYAAATRGEAALRWSPGLRAAVLLEEEEKSDEEIAAETSAAAVSMVALTIPQWLWIMSHELRAELLGAACTGDPGEVVLWLSKQGIHIEPWQIGFRVRAETVHKRE